MEWLIRQDFSNRRAGVLLIDPHGTLFESLRQYAAEKCPHLADRFLFLSLTDDFVIGFNPIPPDARENMDYVIEMLVSAILKAWGQDRSDDSPRIARWLENILTLILSNGLLLTDAGPLLNVSKRYDAMREKLLTNVENETVRDDWETFHQLSIPKRQELLEGCTNRLRKFLRNPVIRTILGQKNGLDFGRVMAEGKIVLVNLNGGNRVPHESARLLGILLVNEVYRLAKMRDPRDPSLKSFYVYLDEMATFVTREVARALEETRKYLVFFTLGHQHLGQLQEEDEYLFNSVLTNCRMKLVFGGLSTPDAEIMTEELAPGFLNHASIKDEMFATRVRHHEETRTVRTRSKGKTKQRSESHAEGTTRARSEARGRTRTRGRSEARTEGISKTRGIAESTGQTRTRGTSRGKSVGKGSMKGTSEGESQTLGRGTSRTQGISTSQGESRSTALGTSETVSRSDTSGHSETAGSSQSQSTGQGSRDSWSTANSRNREVSPRDHSSVSRSNSESQGRQSNRNTSATTSVSASHAQSQSHSEGKSTGQSITHTHGSNQSTGRQWSTSQSETQSQGQNTGRSSSDSASRSRTQGTSESWSKSGQRTRSEGETESRSESISRSWGEALSRSFSTSEGTSNTRSTGTSSGVSSSDGESIVPFLRPEEYRELSSRSFWNKEELLFLFMAALKNQPVGSAVLKVGNHPPTPLRISYVKPVRYSQFTSPLFLDSFLQRARALNPEYVPVEALEMKESEAEDDPKKEIPHPEDPFG